MSKLLRIFTLGVVLGFFVTTACSNAGVLESKKRSSSSKANGETPQLGEMLAIGISLAEKRVSGLALADENVSAFSILLDGCASGYTTTATESNPTLNVYKSDLDCLAKLQNFTVGSTVYRPQTNFTTFLAGDTATFVADGDTSNKLSVRVEQQLSSPVVSTDKISYSYSQIVQGTNTVFNQGDISSQITLSVIGKQAPRFRVKAFSFGGISSSGAGKFTFRLECEVAMVGSGLDATCDGRKLSDVKYVLVKDTYSSVLSSTQAVALFNGGGRSIGGTKVLASGTAGIANGGFDTESLDGPGPLLGQGNANMILALGTGDISFTYFNVDVTLLSP